MSEQMPLTPNIPESGADIITPQLLEERMAELQQRLADAVERIWKAEQEMRKTAKRSVEGWMKHDHEAWMRWKDAKEAYAELVENVANQELHLGESIPVPDGAYAVDLEFTNYKGEIAKMNLHLFYPADHTHLASVLKSAWGAIVELGIHNFGFKVSDGSRMGVCSIVLHGPEDFSYHSRCFVDASGHIIRRKGDVK